MKTNVKVASPHRTHEGAVSPVVTAEFELRRAVMACLLWERQFYESGVDVVTRIKQLVKKCDFDTVAAIAIDAREKSHLRHVPLLLVRELLRNHSGRKVGDLIERVIQRPDELTELLSLYWKDDEQAKHKGDKSKSPLSAQLKVGLARALKKFSEYSLQKYNRDGAIKLRDILFLSHAKPDNEEQEALFKMLAEDTMATPDTWETGLSAIGQDATLTDSQKRDAKAAVFVDLLSSGKLGAMALLRNLRLTRELGVSEDVIRDGLAKMKATRVLPFRFISAAKYAPDLEDALEAAMFKCLEAVPKLKGKTALLIDHSGSMRQAVSEKSEISRFDAAAAVAMILREVCPEVRVYTFAEDCVKVPARRGFALIDAVKKVVNPVATKLGKAVRKVYEDFPECERLIVITDEQSADRPPAPKGKGYIINCAGYQNGIGWGDGSGGWITISGWSDSIVNWINAYEGETTTLVEEDEQ